MSAGVVSEQQSVIYEEVAVKMNSLSVPGLGLDRYYFKSIREVNLDHEEDCAGTVVEDRLHYVDRLGHCRKKSPLVRR